MLTFSDGANSLVNSMYNFICFDLKPVTNFSITHKTENTKVKKKIIYVAASMTYLVFPFVLALVGASAPT